MNFDKIILNFFEFNQALSQILGEMDQVFNYIVDNLLIIQKELLYLKLKDFQDLQGI